MTGRKPRRATLGDDANPAQPYGVLGDDGVVRVILPVRRFRVLFVDGATVDVETAGGLSSIERGLLVEQYGAIAGCSAGVHVGWTGETAPAALFLPTDSPRIDAKGSPGMQGADESVPSTT